MLIIYILESEGYCVTLLDRVMSFTMANKFRSVNSSPPGQYGRHFPNDISRCLLMNEKFCILIKVSPKFVPKCPIDNNPALVQIMAWHQIGARPLSEPMLTDSLTHVCGTRGWWVNSSWHSDTYGVGDLSQHWFGNSLLPDGTKPLPGPMLPYHQWGPVAISWLQFHKRNLSH